MEKKIKRLKFSNYGSSKFMKVNGLYCFYSSKILSYKVPFSVYDSNRQFVENIVNNGFHSIHRIMQNNLLFSHEKINELKKDTRWTYFVLEKDLNIAEVQEYFSFRISLQINGKRITDFYPLSRGRTRIDEDIITFIGYEGHEDGRFGKLGATADALFGPRYITESSYRINDDRCSEEYRKHISEIEKIILTKEFRDIEVIGTPNEFHLNGKKETIELDLRNPDMEVYEQIRAIDNCIEIIWE